MKDEICIVGESGGMMNAFGSGYLRAADLDPRSFECAIGVSSSALMLAYFFSEQHQRAWNLWINEHTKPEVYSLLNPISRRTMPANVNHLIKVSTQHLNLSRLVGNLSRFLVHTYDPVALQPEFSFLHPGTHKALFKATCALPPVASAVKVGDRIFIDGGVYDPLPVMKAYELGFRRILVIGNKPSDFEPPKFSKVLKAMILYRWPKARVELDLRIERYKKAKEFLAKPPKGVSVFYVQPEKMLCHVLERDINKMKAVYEIGSDLGYAQSADLKAWIRG